MLRSWEFFDFQPKKAHVVCQIEPWVRASFYFHSTVLGPYSVPMCHCEGVVKLQDEG